MNAYDLAVRGGTITTATDTFRGDIGVRDGRIVAIADRIDGASREVDASGLIVMPGGIDSHVHLAQPAFGGPKMADDFLTGNLCPRDQFEFRCLLGRHRIGVGP